VSDAARIGNAGGGDRMAPVRPLSRRLVDWLVAIAISLACVEIALHAAVRLGFSDLDLPGYSLAQAQPFWQDINADFGVWHPANARYRHHKSCFDLTYTSNAHGMRDRDVELASSASRVVVLGDSFVEGWGVADEHRFTERLAALTGVAHLNFGVSGDFGSTQAYLLYKTLASRFDHRAVILAILPQNDFRDDMPLPQRLRRGARHRPYLIGNYPDYALRYPAGGWPPDRQWSWQVKNVLREFWLTFRAADHAVGLGQQAIAFWRKSKMFDPLHSFYFDYAPEQLDRLRYAIERIKAIAGDRAMLIVTIPHDMDYRRAAVAGGTPPLTRALADLARTLGIAYADLLERSNAEEREQYFLSCDPHWSEAGHRLAAEVIAEWSFYRR
jgi:lysophospholipase L1-like esterase